MARMENGVPARDALDCAFARRTEICSPTGWRRPSRHPCKEELAAPDGRRFYNLNPSRMGPRDRTRSHEANEIGVTDLCRPGVLMMMMMMIV